MKFFRLIFYAVLIAVPAAYAVILVYYYFAQESHIFKKQPITEDRLMWIKKTYSEVSEVNLKTPEGVKLHGWFLKGDSAKSPLIIFFAGNADEVSTFIPEFKKYLSGFSVLLMNYRGYGISEGTPGERELFGDAEYLYDSFVKENEVDSSRVVSMGRSLGTGVAVHLASVRPVKGVVLISPYDSIASVAKGMYPFLPVSLLLKHPFDSISLAPKIQAPAIAFVSKDDDVIPPYHSMRLMDRWAGVHALIVVDAEGHGEILEKDAMWKDIEEFLEGIK